MLNGIGPLIYEEFVEILGVFPERALSLATPRGCNFSFDGGRDW